MSVAHRHAEREQPTRDRARESTIKHSGMQASARWASYSSTTRRKKVRFLLVEHGGFLGFGDTKTLIPVDAVTKTTEHEVLIAQSRARVVSAPDCDPHLVDDRPHHASIYDHYGYLPYWSAGYPFAAI